MIQIDVEQSDAFLTGRELRFVVHLALFVPLVHIILRFLGYGRTLRILASLSQHANASPLRRDRELPLHRMPMLVRIVRQRSPLPGTCLSRSLALWWMLRRRGVKTGIRIGTSKAAGHFRAHSWVEYQGKPLNAARRVRHRYAAFDCDFSLL